MAKYIGVGKKRGAPRTEGNERLRLWSPYNPEGFSSPQRLKSWAHEILQVLDKPNVAVCIFIFGVIIIVVASKQLKMTFDVLEYYWEGSRPQDGFIGNFMVILVFMFVWLDTVVLQWIKEIIIHLHAFFHRRYHQIVEALEKIQEEDEIQSLQRRKLLRKRKAVSPKRWTSNSTWGATKKCKHLLKEI
ncbi:hypothetical protein RRG08_013040 [Elysia crispata]|uniref:Uncharacterized protein n=1 Tax=Elysia crispata TaxID=231223 RepID=A0AAE1DQP5_9GAST|nr:hypothetical protein RRG08_013040 [Elysia crispata]